jgi:retron-type reverse transcriptase
MTATRTSPRRYRFSEHGVTEYPERGRQRNRRAPNNDLPPLTLAGIINRENLVRVFKRIRSHAGKGTGIDGYQYREFSITEMGDIADDITAAINEQRWRPAPSRRKMIPKPPRGERPLDIRCHIDRLVSSAVTEVVSAALEPIFLPTSFAYRPNRSVHGLLAILAHFVEHEGSCVIGKDDVANAFPSVRISDVMQDYASVVEDPGLLHLIEVILRGHRESRLGLEQGDPLSPPTLNLRLHHCQDLPSLETTGPDNPLRLRYADDVVYLSHSVSEGQRAIESDAALLQALLQNLWVRFAVDREQVEDGRERSLEGEAGGVEKHSGASADMMGLLDDHITFWRSTPECDWKRSSIGWRSTSRSCTGRVTWRTASRGWRWWSRYVRVGTVVRCVRGVGITGRRTTTWRNVDSSTCRCWGSRCSSRIGCVA